MTVQPLQWMIGLLACLLLVFSTASQAQSSSPNEAILNHGELDQLLAPIALYPDALLSQILMAATYPPEIEEAAKWSAANSALDGEEAASAMADQDWDQSVKAVAAFPSLLARMADDREWTRRLGDAYLAQEGDVIDRIQVLREQAYTAGHLNDMEYQRAYRDRDMIVIEPMSAQVLHVPYYQPRHVYSAWRWPAHPAHQWRAPRGYQPGMAFYWGRGVSLSPMFFLSTVHWHDRHIVMFDRHHPAHYPPAAGRRIYSTRPDWTHRWHHNPYHRRGMAYSHRAVQQRFLHHPGYHWYGQKLPASHSRSDYVPRRELMPGTRRSDWQQPVRGGFGYPVGPRGYPGGREHRSDQR